MRVNEQDIGKILSIVYFEYLLKNLDHTLYILFPIYMIIKKCIKVGKLPIIWKQANVTPIYKGDSKFEAVNFRPVSLTSIPCKIAEAVIVGNINNHMLTNDLFCKKTIRFYA